MYELDPIGFYASCGPALFAEKGYAIRHVDKRVALRRVMEFTRCTINDVINDRIARQKVKLYFKLSRHIDREYDRTDAERWGNPKGWSRKR